jgi:hypothetical protein
MMERLTAALADRYRRGGKAAGRLAAVKLTRRPIGAARYDR